MNPAIQSLIDRLNAIDASGDTEHDHGEADDILVDALRYLGQTELADAYVAAKERSGFWYA